MNGASYLNPSPRHAEPPADATLLIHSWPHESKHVAEATIAAHGPPHEATASQLMWFDNEPWKLTVVRRDGAWHNFPQSHLDILCQTVNYQVPIDKVDDICAFDGSIMVDRTRGELSVCSESERMNILAINIAHAIAQGKMTVKDARRQFTEASMALRLNWPVPDAEQLQFSTVRDYELQPSTADPDQQTMGGSLFKQLNRMFKG